MEKIYEESSGRQQRPKLSLSIILSFVVAIFAIVSLIVVGFNQISYAAPATIDGNTMTLHLGQINGNQMFVAAINNEYNSPAQNGEFRVPLMFADSSDALTATKPVFCVQQGVDAGDNTSYSSNVTDGGGQISDAGLIYIMNKSKVLGGSGIVKNLDSLTYPTENTAMAGNNLEPEHKKFVEMYATQIAIWIYLHESATYDGTPFHGQLAVPQTYNNQPRDYTPWQVITGSSVRLEVVVPQENSGSVLIIYSGNIYSDIRQVVNEAKSGVSYKTVIPHLESENISTIGDDDIFQTDKITVVATPKDDLINYSVDLSGIDGAYVVDKDGNTKTSLDTFAPGDYFYIRVPVNKVTDASQEVTVSIVGEFQNYLSGDFFAATNQQQIIGVTSERFRVTNEMKINFMRSPDTGMSAAQTIYFIGLIVLLCGVGIIYANAKPVEQE